MILQRKSHNLLIPYICLACPILRNSYLPAEKTLPTKKSHGSMLWDTLPLTNLEPEEGPLVDFGSPKKRGAMRGSVLVRGMVLAAGLGLMHQAFRVQVEGGKVTA